METDSIENILKICDLFEGESDNDIEKLLPLCREESYSAGATIFSEGAPCDTVHIIKSGRVALERNLHIGMGEEAATADVITRGGCLALSGLLDPPLLSATGRALEPCQLISLSTADLRGLFQENHEMERIAFKNAVKILCSRLEHMRERLGSVFSVIFHDFKAPLAAAESFNRLILHGYVGELNEEQRGMLQDSSKRISYLIDLVSNIMDVSRIGAKHLVMSEIALGQVLMDSIEAIEPLAEEKGLQLKVELDAELPHIYGAQDRLQQLIVNLLSNAVKFTPSGGVITVTARDGVDDLRVSVLDTGTGIPAEELPRIFDDYHRGLDSTARGAGLGLAIARRVVEAHQGKIWASSPPPGSDKGTEVIFTLPKKPKLADAE